MAGSRDTSSDIGQNNKVKLSPTAVNNELQRLERTKADKTWAEGEFKIATITQGHLEKRVEGMDEELAEIAKTGANNANKASEAKRLAGEATEAAGVHECLHKDTMTNISRDMLKTTKKVDDLDVLFRKSLTWATRFVVIASIVVGGFLVVWQVRLSLQGAKLELLQVDTVQAQTIDKAQAEEIKSIQEKLRTDPESVILMKTAFEQVLDARAEEEAKAVETKPPRGGRRRPN